MAKTETKNTRSPVVVVLGHVDHGKTSLLDAIRNTSVQTGESGGITQNIYISDVEWKNKHITFIDTPGHEVFSLMRINGGKVADIALLIVAADEGVKPQTMESIDIITKQKVKFIVVLTKVDKPEANVQGVINELIAKGVYLEGYGGDIPYIEVSAQNKKGLDHLLDFIFLFTEVENILDPENEKLKLIDYYGQQIDNITSYGVVLDSSIDKALGKTVFGVLKYGTIKKGDELYFGSEKEKAGMLFNPAKKPVQIVNAGDAFIMTGLKELPSSGVDIIAAKDLVTFEKLLKEKTAAIVEAKKLDGDELLDSIFADTHEFVVPIILRTDVKASLQSLIPTFEKFNQENLIVKVVSSGVGAITTSDVDLAKTFKAILFGFRVKPQNSVIDYARQNNIELNSFDVVYHLYDYLSGYIEKLLGKSGDKSVVIGSLKVKQVFTLSNGEVVAGSVVTDGEIKKNSICRILRGGAVIGEYPVQSLRVLKEEKNEVKKGAECGVSLGKEVDVKEGDIIEVVAKSR